MCCCTLNTAPIARSKWLSSAFPRLPKVRGSKQNAQNAPIHNYKAHDRFELSVGPHVFPDTALFEAIYTYGHEQNATSRPAGFTSPELISLVSAAEVNNPQLKVLLDELRKQPIPDDDLVTKLADMLRAMVPNIGVDAAEPQEAPTAKWDLVIEFKEKPHDRWIFPRGSVQFEKAYDTARGRRVDVRVVTRLPYRQEQIGHDLQLSDPNAAPADAEDTPQPVTFHWKGVSEQVYDMLTRWSMGNRGADSAAKPKPKPQVNRLHSFSSLIHKLELMFHDR